MWIVETKKNKTWSLVSTLLAWSRDLIMLNFKHTYFISFKSSTVTGQSRVIIFV